MNKLKFKDFSHLKTCEELNQYIKDRKHQCYFHYTNCDAINSIIKEKCIYLSSVKRLNDKREIFPKDEKSDEYTNKYYTLCFSTGKNENLSLWYLYSGIKGNGGRIELTNANLLKLKDTSHFELWECDTKSKIMDLVPEKDIKLELKDVIYARCTTKQKYCDLKYNTMTNYGNVTKNDLDLYKEQNIGFVKGLIWYYEKEARILATISDSVVSLLNNNNKYFIKAYFNEKILDSLKITFAPEIEKIDDGCTAYPYIKQFMEKTSHIKLSDYKGEIVMKLFDEDKYKDEICKNCSKNKNK